MEAGLALPSATTAAYQPWDMTTPRRFTLQSGTDTREELPNRYMIHDTPLSEGDPGAEQPDRASTHHVGCANERNS